MRARERAHERQSVHSDFCTTNIYCNGLQQLSKNRYKAPTTSTRSMHTHRRAPAAAARKDSRRAATLPNAPAARLPRPGRCEDDRIRFLAQYNECTAYCQISLPLSPPDRGENWRVAPHKLSTTRHNHLTHKLNGVMMLTISADRHTHEITFVTRIDCPVDQSINSRDVTRTHPLDPWIRPKRRQQIYI